MLPLSLRMTFDWACWYFIERSFRGEFEYVILMLIPAKYKTKIREQIKGLISNELKTSAVVFRQWPMPFDRTGIFQIYKPIVTSAHQQCLI